MLQMFVIALLWMNRACLLREWGRWGLLCKVVCLWPALQEDQSIIAFSFCGPCWS